MNDFVYTLKNSLPNLLLAILLIALAIVLGYLAKTVIKNIYNNSKLDDKLNLDSSEVSLGNLLGNLGFLLVVLFFLPGILSLLGLNFISVPFNTMLNEIYAFLPRLLGASLILIFGVMLAKLVRDISSLFFRKIGVDTYAAKFSNTVEDSNRTKFSQLLGKLLYILILIPIIIASLNTLNISVISQPAVAILNDIFRMIPLIVASAIVICLGIFIAKVAADFIYTMVSVSGINESLATAIEDTAPYKFDLSKVISEIVRFVIIAIFTVQGLNILGLDLLNRGGQAILTYIPKILSALVLIIGGYILASFIKKVIKNTFKDGVFAGIIAKGVIMTLVTLAALSQLGIATEFILPLFKYTVLALSVALALAFGLGGKKFAEKQLDRIDKTIDEASNSLEETKAKIVSEEKEKEEKFNRELQVAKVEYDKKVDDIKDEIKKKKEAFNEAKEQLKKELEEKRLQKERQKAEEQRRKEEERRRIEEEKQRILEEERLEKERKLLEEKKALEDKMLLESQKNIENNKIQNEIKDINEVKKEEKQQDVTVKEFGIKDNEIQNGESEDVELTRSFVNSNNNNLNSAEEETKNNINTAASKDNK